MLSSSSLKRISASGLQGFRAKDGFVLGSGILLVFEKGEPLGYQENIQFGFRCNQRDAVVAWIVKFVAQLVEDDLYCAFKTQDPEGNVLKFTGKHLKSPYKV